MAQRHRASGFSFIEVLISLGLLALTLISITSVFALAHRQVNSGGTATEALAAARSILEEMQDWGYGQSYAAYGLDGSTTSATVDTRTNAFAARWQPALEAKLARSYGTIEIAALEAGGTTPTLSASHGIRIVVTIHWSEGKRPRSVNLTGVKT